ncbi:NADH-quinone oxidoreductase subunit J [Dyadobacter sp. CY261]|uniref:NADH-quinone oxidoreductase subunit J family protein n=1 Tax=Dyadobacter sp. CY261 TaxID=2907203 RepID=UPI001F3E45A0|nr:NADH-quinone oxidoreductase subunit J [Dyadobacter sp. CY261]MCF0072434.1 NADH-quinone oxidoreductase subunit J [Dyadobacter sp. CY261]
MEAIIFYIFSALTLAAGLFILFSKNLIYGAFALFLAFLGVAALYVLAGADFLAVSQIMIYVGGILVLLIFGIMLTQKKEKSDDSTRHNRVEAPISRQVWGSLIGTGFFILMLKVILSSDFKMAGEEMSSKSTIKTIGVALMTSHLLPFEIAAILLLVALIGAAYLALNRNPSS